VPLQILDLGSGSGAAIWGLIVFLEEELQQPIEIEIMAVDSVAQNLKDIRTFHDKLLQSCEYVKSTLQTKLLDLEQEISVVWKFDLITMMNTLNELSDAAEEKTLNTLPNLLEEKGTVLFIEPATRKQSRRLLTFRDAAIKNNWTIYAPCTRQSNCPALEKDDNWCHSEYKWERPDFIRLIDDITGTLRLSIKCTYFTMNRSGQRLPDVLGKTNLWRSVSERFDEKGRVRSILCGEPARTQFILNKRDKTDGNREFMKLERYDLIEVTNEERREHDWRITENSTNSIVLPVLGA
jgi:ribosomal protein RSM22 (predicted rRNA methylase)